MEMHHAGCGRDFQITQSVNACARRHGRGHAYDRANGRPRVRACDHRHVNGHDCARALHHANGPCEHGRA